MKIPVDNKNIALLFLEIIAKISTAVIFSGKGITKKANLIDLTPEEYVLEELLSPRVIKTIIPNTKYIYNIHLKIKMSDRNFTQRFDVVMTSLSSDKKITVQQCYI